MFILRLLGSASLDGPDGPVGGRAALRQRIALLALLAVEHPRPLSRDRLVASLWPENGTDEARHLLRDALYILRMALGDDSVLSTGDDLRLNPARLSCDLWEFEAALERHDPEAAVGVYRGPFLSGFHLSDAEELERWMDWERSRLARRYNQALEELAEGETRRGSPLQAVEWWARLAREDPYNSRVALRYMQALDAAGDRAAALRHAGVHSDLLRDDLGTVPEAEVVALAERLRVESRAPTYAVQASTPTNLLSVPPGDVRKETPLAAPAREAGRAKRREWVIRAAIAVAVVVGFGVLGTTHVQSRSPTLNPRRVAVAVFENHTGRRDLDDLGSMTADWIIRGLMETPLINVTDLETVYAREPTDSGARVDPRSLARRNGAGLVVSGSYYRSADSVLFLADILDVKSGRVLRSFDPIGAPVNTPTGVLDDLRKGIANGLSALVNPANQVFPVDPDLVPPPNYPAYREFIAGLRQGMLDDWESESRHYRRSAEMDSTFPAPLVQLAYRATWRDQCELTDSVATVLERRKEILTPWDRITISLLWHRCRGDMETAVELMGQRFQAYPRSLTARRQYSTALQFANKPRAVQQVLSGLDPELGPTGRYSRDFVRAKYWSMMAASHHMLGQYREELESTDRWLDSSADWLVTRGRALAALGRTREVLQLTHAIGAGAIESVPTPGLVIAEELAAHGNQRAAMAVAESMLVRLNGGGDTTAGRELNIALANLLLGRADAERAALEYVAQSDNDSLVQLEAQARIAVLVSDTARAEKIDRALADQSNRLLRMPQIRAAQILARAHIAAGFGRREQAVALLRDAAARGMLDLGSSHAFHADPLLASLRGYPPFDALLVPDH